MRCDGLVVATPAGSTGYNLANGGPDPGMGGRGFAVSFIAPHSLTARALVVAPDDALTIYNARARSPCEITVDGRPAGELAPGEDVQSRFAAPRGTGPASGASFYHRLREKFGALGASDARPVGRSCWQIRAVGADRPLDPLGSRGYRPAPCCKSCASRTCC